ncbi:MAG: autotransporter outer membrane beta-barrel domain-containing protein [Anaerobiospirillum sp.]|nr:autotransporter outer membrane beta-barrel domain-containing protein [Anaerobiospirillum sp.]
MLLYGVVMLCTALALGVRGAYHFTTSYGTITPHIGLSYLINLDLDAYEVKVNGTTITHNDAEKLNLWALPVGVTFSSNIEAGAWQVKPQLDLTVTANLGDDEIDTSATFVGVKDELLFTTEVLDDFTYRARLGLEAQYQDSLFVGLNLGYTGSSNFDELGLSAIVSYKF